MSEIVIPPAALQAGAKELAMNCRCDMACDWRNHLEDARAAFVVDDLYERQPPIGSTPYPFEVNSVREGGA